MPRQWPMNRQLRRTAARIERTTSQGSGERPDLHRAEIAPPLRPSASRISDPNIARPGSGERAGACHLPACAVTDGGLATNHINSTLGSETPQLLTFSSL